MCINYEFCYDGVFAALSVKMMNNCFSTLQLSSQLKKQEISMSLFISATLDTNSGKHTSVHF